MCLVFTSDFVGNICTHLVTLADGNCREGQHLQDTQNPQFEIQLYNFKNSEQQNPCREEF